MKLWIHNGRLISEDKVIPNAGIVIEDGKITSLLEPGDPHPSGMVQMVDVKGKFISPGFIDVHVHGGGGIEVMGASPQALVDMCTAHSKYGTTSILPTTLASPVDDLCDAIDSIRDAQGMCKDCNILGVHLEGPFLSHEQAGAQAPGYIYTATEDVVPQILDRWCGIKMMGAAPEVENGLWLGDQLRKRNIVASIAHSNATFDEVVSAFDYGYEDITHIYSGCSSLYRKNAYRFAGVVEAGLYDDRFTTQVIADGKHLPSSLLKLIYKCKGADRIVLISDGLAMSASDVKQGDTYLQKNGVLTVMDDGVMKLTNKQSFAGSIATMSSLVRNMVTLAEVPIYEAVKMASFNPARLVRVESQKGSLSVGKDADVIVFDECVDVSLTVTMGKIVFDKGDCKNEIKYFR